MFFLFKTILAIVVFLLFFSFSSFLPNPFYNNEAEFSSRLGGTKIENIDEKDEVILELKKEIIVKPKVQEATPLRIIKAEVKINNSLLTIPGIISWTNFFRQTNNFLPLKENTDLNSIALGKLEDMLKRQYFEHTSPSGEMAGDIAKMFGYKFMLIGENLAMGDFLDDEDVVKAWMDSPGHRANILKPSYAEIGVAAKKGFLNGREVWMSVQIFAVPLAFCKSPESGLLEKIESNKAQLKSTKEHLDLLQNVIEEEKYQTREEYEKLVAEYNSLIPSYNFLSQSTKSLTEEYNNEVALFNQCVDSFE